MAGETVMLTPEQRRQNRSPHEVTGYPTYQMPMGKFPLNPLDLVTLEVEHVRTCFLTG